MLHTITQLDKLAALKHIYLQCGMLVGTISAYIAKTHELGNMDSDSDNEDAAGNKAEECDVNNVSPAPGPHTLSSVQLASQSCKLQA